MLRFVAVPRGDSRSLGGGGRVLFGDSYLCISSCLPSLIPIPLSPTYFHPPLPSPVYLLVISLFRFFYLFRIPVHLSFSLPLFSFPLSPSIPISFSILPPAHVPLSLPLFPSFFLLSIIITHHPPLCSLHPSSPPHFPFPSLRLCPSSPPLFPSLPLLSCSKIFLFLRFSSHFFPFSSSTLILHPSTPPLFPFPLFIYLPSSSPFPFPFLVLHSFSQSFSTLSFPFSCSHGTESGRQGGRGEGGGGGEGEGKSVREQGRQEASGGGREGMRRKKGGGGHFSTLSSHFLTFNCYRASFPLPPFFSLFFILPFPFFLLLPLFSPHPPLPCREFETVSGFTLSSQAIYLNFQQRFQTSVCRGFMCLMAYC